MHDAFLIKLKTHWHVSGEFDQNLLIKWQEVWNASLQIDMGNLSINMMLLTLHYDVAHVLTMPLCCKVFYAIFPNF